MATSVCVVSLCRPEQQAAVPFMRGAYAHRRWSTGGPPPWYYVDQANTKQGPFTLNEMVGNVQAGTINSETLIWTRAMLKWSLLVDVPQLRDLCHVPCVRCRP